MRLDRLRLAIDDPTRYAPVHGYSVLQADLDLNCERLLAVDILSIDDFEVMYVSLRC